jgi:hypothetical protein
MGKDRLISKVCVQSQSHGSHGATCQLSGWALLFAPLLTCVMDGSRSDFVHGGRIALLYTPMFRAHLFFVKHVLHGRRRVP